MIYRKSAFDAGESKAQDAFKKGVEAMIKSGEYVKFVNGDYMVVYR